MAFFQMILQVSVIVTFMQDIFWIFCGTGYRNHIFGTENMCHINMDDLLIMVIMKQAAGWQARLGVPALTLCRRGMKRGAASVT